eukprot:3651990-Amphidinium_carterae.2
MARAFVKLMSILGWLGRGLWSVVKVPDLPGKVGALLVEFGHLRQDPSVKDTDKGLVVLAVFEQERGHST